jgi:xylulose-5-phosphate/fructose-6-phosphate phosphoketolase
VATQEALAAAALLRQHFPDLKATLRQRRRPLHADAAAEHPHGLVLIRRLRQRTVHDDKPIIFNFHGYPWLIHRLSYRRTNHDNLHVRGYKEKGNINTPLELAIRNEVDRFSLAIDVIDRVPDACSAWSARAQLRTAVRLPAV